MWNQVRVNSKDTRATLLASFWSFGCSTLVGQHPMKLLSSVSVRLSVRPSLSFLKIGSLLSSDIVHDDSWPWYLMTDSQISEKKISAKIGPETRYFAIFSSLVDYFSYKLYTMMRKGLNSSRDKTHEKKIGGPKVGPNEPKLGQKFLSCHFLKFV